MPSEAVECQIFGIVQGVGFRYSAQAQASRFRLVGWVKNCADGSVELYAEGEPAQLQQFVQWLHKGPPGARVERVEVRKVMSKGTFRRFAIERDF